MTDQELLKAMSDMLQPILSEIKDMKKDISEIKERVDTIDKRVETIDKKVDRNYNLTLEFYGNQKEHNTEVSETLDILNGEMEMHNNQIARNTAALKRYK